MRIPAALIQLILAAAMAAAVAGCGGSSSSSSSPNANPSSSSSSSSASASPSSSSSPSQPRRAVPINVALDFTPNPAHVPLYEAVADHLDQSLGVRLQIHAPGSGPDSLKLLLAGRVDMSLLDIDDLGLAVEKGADVVGVAALVQQPLGAIIAQPGIHRPRELMGRRVGVSGLPSDPAFLRAVVSQDGGDPRRLDEVTIGFNAVADMVAGDIAAVPAFWSDEAVALRRRGIHVNVFRVDRYGAPEYPELVFAVRRSTLSSSRREWITRALAAVAAGEVAARHDPVGAARLITAAAGSADPGLIRAQTAVILPAFTPPLTLSLPALRGWADFTARTGLLPGRLNLSRAFDTGLTAPALALAKRATGSNSGG